MVAAIMDELSLQGTVTARESRNGTFVSVTVTAVFPSEEVLNDLCGRVSDIEGFVMLF